MRRIGLGAFFASVAVNAALGIFAVLAPAFGETQGKILATSLCVTGAALLTLACEPAWERRVLGPMPFLGAALGVVGLGLAVVGIWAEPEGDLLGKATGSLVSVAIGCAAASLLGLVRLTPGHTWVLRVALVLIAVGALLVAIAPWLGDDPSEWYLRTMGVVLIALAAFVVSVPVLHWVDRRSPTLAELPSDGVRFCPYCGGRVDARTGGVVACARCGRGFIVAARGGAAGAARDTAPAVVRSRVQATSGIGWKRSKSTSP